MIVKEREKTSISDAVRGDAIPLRPNEMTDYDSLIDQIANARFVLIGEASHGTHEFYH